MYIMSYKAGHMSISLVMLGEVDIIRQHCDGGYEIKQKLISLDAFQVNI